MNPISSTFPILVMTRNDGLFLKQCVESIINTVSIATTIYIIDNNSDSLEHHAVINDLVARFDNIKPIFNKKNLWVLGLNDTIKKIKHIHQSKYFFLTDADIDFSHCKARPCWLSYLIQQLEKNVAIGKLGISLSWDYLREKKELISILEQEQSLYSEVHKIDDLYVSSVDTTATIFRFDWSIEDSSCFFPDHMRYLRPELYSCRTPKDIVVEHLGWYHYSNSSQINVNKTQVNSKVLCFTLFGGSVKDTILDMADKKYSLFYKTFSNSIRRVWGLRRLYFLFKYFLFKARIKLDGHGF
ncbi:TPA: glycosyltransferase [Escherichia coli]|nr:glycosyltransferase [Escherichia coli]MCV5281691.1 glycosyltransferase [Escherichia coli]